ncbi:Filamentation induced by cAMP protein Fic [hydrothermal vent metagenome]|uniref:Filamentation induced by cAMP protein Fic n=1 Tax=hydrothermal vent metagenome TaxID=652676 RepID=A0A1W1BB49_9ZZZZ
MKLKAVGYEALIKQFHIDTIPNWHCSFVALDSHTHKVEQKGNIIHEIYPKKYMIDETIMNHLEFALKYDGVNLTLLIQIFEQIKPRELIEYIISKPTGKYVRRLWFFYEFLMNRELPIEDLKQGNYIDLLEEERYYTAPNPKSIKRQRVRDNLLGVRNFCPMVRKTDRLKKYEELNLSQKSKDILTKYPDRLLKRALSYLYTKETKSSFEIEQVKPSSSRIEKFIVLLKEAQKDDFCTKEKLLFLQNRIVDSRFRDTDYRTTQNYVGESISYTEEKIHYISPKPDVLDELMDGLITAHQKIKNNPSLAVVHATVIAYGFVYLHPFEDGNGRIHRFLLHNILANEGFTPKNMIFPLSAVMLKNPNEYEISLEYFSSKLLSLIDYNLDSEGRMEVLNNTTLWYRTIDMTQQVEALYGFIEKTIEEELYHELEFIVRYDNSKRAIQAIVDMPDRAIDLFIRFVMQNGGTLSANKRKKYFEFLSDEEIGLMEESVYYIN